MKSLPPRFVIFIASGLLTYLSIGAYLYLPTNDGMVNAIGKQYSNSIIPFDMAQKESWGTESVYIPTIIWCRYPTILKKQEHIQIFTKYATAPWFPIEYAMLHLNYNCLHQIGDVMHEISTTDATRIIKDNKMFYVGMNQNAWW